MPEASSPMDSTEAPAMPFTLLRPSSTLCVAQT